MSHNNTVLSQLLKLIPRHEMERLSNHYDGKRRSDALSRWSQFVALLTGHLSNRRSLSSGVKSYISHSIALTARLTVA